MDEINTTTGHQYIINPRTGEKKERHEVRSINKDEDDLYVSRVYVESGDVESRYEPTRSGWEYGREIDEAELPDQHIEELSDIKDRLSEDNSITTESGVEKAEI